MAEIREVTVPDIGDFPEVEVIEVLVAVGDEIEQEESLISLESDKATMEIPAPFGGVVKELKVSVGDKVSEGALIMMVESAEEAAVSESLAESPAESQTDSGAEHAATAPSPAAVTPAQQQTATPAAPVAPATGGKAHASPAIRRFARELGVVLSQVGGTGPKGRILKEDVKQFVKAALSGGATPQATGSAIPEITLPDFSKFGETESQPLSRIKKISGKHLHACWLNIPHVTQFDEADITKLEEFRQSNKEEAEKRGVRLTPLVFIMKAVVAALKEFPQFNASLDLDNEQLIIKNYYNIGVAVDTPNGLMVPVVREVDRKGVYDLAEELMEISSRARDGKLKGDDLQGGTFSISSLGGIGGTQFTPIVNAPEVAILGVARSQTKPVWSGTEFEPRLMLPLALSYDHRVIDGADGARFITRLNQLLREYCKVLL
ncbi:MAG: dihydrolipoyllysine-residue acetyltransferase [Gammaproteobacteria bacterium]|uniref:Acetyltransferase component of pyruvate dehydrogenase complex n=1 Tax=Candidatus Thiopontia autotrophica TaxID=2841688 RepID=A0A8J6TX91_9GAMM|nr:dihydrolipoyllysine-residue acetyltransferase [Candidatus Thiopontia autotrophica]